MLAAYAKWDIPRVSAEPPPPPPPPALFQEPLQSSATKMAGHREALQGAGSVTWERHFPSEPQFPCLCTGIANTSGACKVVTAGQCS